MDQGLSSNTYHLWLLPQDELISIAQVVPQISMNLTDSGGFQVYSLADSRNITEEGVTFKPSQWLQDVLSPEKGHLYS